MLVMPTSRCLASAGMLRLSMETSAATSKARLTIWSTLIEPRSSRRLLCAVAVLAMGLRRRPERHGDGGRRAEGLAPDTRVVVGDELDAGQPVEQAFQRHAGFHAR